MTLTVSAHVVSRTMLQQRKLQVELAALARKRRAAQQKLGALQKVLSDVHVLQGREVSKEAASKKTIRELQEKHADYQAKCARLASRLEKYGFKPEVGNSCRPWKFQSRGAGCPPGCGGANNGALCGRGKLGQTETNVEACMWGAGFSCSHGLS